MALRSASRIVSDDPIPRAEERERGRQRLARVCGVRNVAEPLSCIEIFANATRDKSLSLDWWRRFLAAFEPRASQHCVVEILPAFGRSLLEDLYPSFYCSEVRGLAAMLANLSLYVSADCGVMHLAWAAGASTIGLFNATEPAEWGPGGGHFAHWASTTLRQSRSPLALRKSWMQPPTSFPRNHVRIRAG